MSERHGTVLKLKRHEEFEKVATYVKQQVREKSRELVGEDLSVNSDLVGLIMMRKITESSGTTMGITEIILTLAPLQKVSSRCSLMSKWSARDGGDKKHGTISLPMANGRNTHFGSLSHIPKVKVRKCF